MGDYRFPSESITPTWGMFISDHWWDGAAKVLSHGLNKE